MASKFCSRYAAGRLERIPSMTVWSEFTPACAKFGAVNLGQGFPNFSPHPIVTKHAQQCITDPNPLSQQYAPARGHPNLIKQLQRRYSTLLGRQVAAEEACVVNGTTQALNICAMAFVNPEEEVIVIEPFFDLYDNDIQLAHGHGKFVPLRPPTRAFEADGKTLKPSTANDWVIDFAELERAIIKGKTKAILINSPQNVPGKVWSREELEKIAALAIKNDLLVFSDEVYDRFTFDGTTHISIASLPGMWERTLTLCSAGKFLCVTGWKIGWIVAPKELIVSCMQVLAHQAFSIATPLQAAVAGAMEEADSEANGGQFERELVESYLRRRTILCDAIKECGLTPVVPQGSYFVMADFSAVPEALYEAKGSEPLVDGAARDVAKDWKFSRWMTKEIGVGCLPCSAFCSKNSVNFFDNFVRFAFCKKEEDLVEAGKRMKERLMPLIERK